MRAKNIISGLVLAILGGVIAVFAYTRFFDSKSKYISAEMQSPVRLAQMTNAFDSNKVDFTFAADKTIHAVVHVKTKSTRSDEYSSGNPFYDFFFGYRGFEQRPQPVEGFGSGVIISDNGYIVTNNHVIDNANEISVTLNDKRSYTAKLVGVDRNTDLAVIKIEEKDLPYIIYGNSDDLKVGEWVLAVGNPYNLTSTVTAGIVSAKARSIGIMGGRSVEANRYPIESFIQTDAAVNPGNSGGALVNIRGELVGINTAIASPTGSYIGNAFAIPVSIVKKAVADIVEFGEVQRAILGVNIKDVDSELATSKKFDKIEGVYVENVVEGSSADVSGIKPGDVILSINGLNVNSASELQEQIGRFRPNDKIEIVVNRENKKKQITATLRNMEGNGNLVKKAEISSILGATLKNVPEDIKSRLNIKGGVQVEEVTSGKFKSAGIQKGFIILQINNKPVYSVDDVEKTIAAINGGVYIEGIYPNSKAVYYYAFGK
ncbi:MAG: Do family serine endopeptidase [Chloroflexia bacterium]|nr:Do family serine endopeptidase [Chloroflexia bacterium]